MYKCTSSYHPLSHEFTGMSLFSPTTPSKEDGSSGDGGDTSSKVEGYKTDRPGFLRAWDNGTL